MREKLTIRDWCNRHRYHDDLESLFDLVWVHFRAKRTDYIDDRPDVLAFLESLPA